MERDDKIARSALKLLSYIENEGYRGFDPYDALKSPLLKFPLSSNKVFRFSLQQLVKRSPLNLRPVLLIPKGYNPVTLGLCLQAYGYLSRVFPEESSRFIEKADFLVGELKRLIAPGYHGACWGYDFDWEARYARIPAYEPTVVATGIITNALFEYYKVTGSSEAYDLCESASGFILEDLNRTYEEELFCFSYSPRDRQVVFNATMKGARCLVQVFMVNHNPLLLEAARSAVKFVLKYQRNDGSWLYGKQSSTDWIDNYHTGYVLDCLHEFTSADKGSHFKSSLEKGVNFYINNFFLEGSVPKFYHNRPYPVDSTAGAQAIISAARFGYKNLALSVACYMIDNMQDDKGYFYFRRYKYRMDRTPFMRWSNAWMLTALAYYLFKEKNI